MIPATCGRSPFSGGGAVERNAEFRIVAKPADFDAMANLDGFCHFTGSGRLFEQYGKSLLGIDRGKNRVEQLPTSLVIAWIEPDFSSALVAGIQISCCDAGCFSQGFNIDRAGV